jgi:hypothetical protein
MSEWVSKVHTRYHIYTVDDDTVLIINFRFRSYIDCDHPLITTF